jgi:NAD(P)-dependent dehydrogenase (short-subunit alcohol dehydrogenase family)
LSRHGPGDEIRRRAGCIVLLDSTAAMWGRIDGAVYSAAKAGVHEYARCLAVQLRPHDVRVNVVAPGGTLSARFVATGQALPERLDTASFLEGYNRPADVAHLVAFLASDDGRRISGQILRVDGAEQCWPG